MITMITFRAAVQSDSDDLLAWRNDPESRQASGSQDPVDGLAHAGWFAASLASPTRTIYLAVDSDSDSSVGMCRFDLDSDTSTAEVSINLNPSWRGRGRAFDVLAGAIATYRAERGTIIPLTATIRSTNEASARIFVKAGFELTESAPPFDHYRLE